MMMWDGQRSTFRAISAT